VPGYRNGARRSFKSNHLIHASSSLTESCTDKADGGAENKQLGPHWNASWDICHHTVQPDVR
jgi:hypothetical protein